MIVATTRSTKPRKSDERPVLIGEVPLERQIGAVELQQKPGVDDRLVFLAQGRAEIVEIGLLGRVMLVFHRPGDDAGRGCGHERLDEPGPGVGERGAEIGDLGLDRVAAEIAHRADRLWRAHVADRRARGELLLHDPPKHRVAQRVGAGAALPRPAKTAHPVADVQEKALALLLAVVADIDARFGLFLDDPAQRRFSQAIEFGGVDRFAARAANVQPGQLRWARQAAGVGRQDPLFAAAHGRSSPRNPLVCEL